MAQIALAASGALLGSAVGQPLIGWAVGSTLGSLLFKQKSEKVINEGSKIGDLSVQTSTYGVPIPTIYGTVKIAGNVIWQTQIKEVKHKDTETHGGKGGGGATGGVKTVDITYQYFVNLAISLGKKLPDADVGIIKIWADNKILFKRVNEYEYGAVTSVTNNRQFKSDITSYPPNFFNKGKLVWITGQNAGDVAEIVNFNADGTFFLKGWAENTIRVHDQFKAIDVKPADYGGDLNFILHKGSETEEVDSVIEGIEGYANANKELIVVVFEDFEITKYGRIPNFTFEVTTTEGTTLEDVTLVESNYIYPRSRGAYDPIGRKVYYISGVKLFEVDIDTQEVLNYTMPRPYGSSWVLCFYIPENTVYDDLGVPYVKPAKIVVCSTSYSSFMVATFDPVTKKIFTQIDPESGIQWLTLFPKNGYTNFGSSIGHAALYPGRVKAYYKSIGAGGVETLVYNGIPSYSLVCVPFSRAYNAPPNYNDTCPNGILKIESPYDIVEDRYNLTSEDYFGFVNPTVTFEALPTYGTQDMLYCGDVTDTTTIGPVVCIDYGYKVLSFCYPSGTVSAFSGFGSQHLNYLSIETGLETTIAGQNTFWELAYDSKRRKVFFALYQTDDPVLYLCIVDIDTYQKQIVEYENTLLNQNAFPKAISALYHKGRDSWLLYVDANNQAGVNVLHEIDPDTHEIKQRLNKKQAQFVHRMLEVPGNTQWVYGHGGVSDNIVQVFLDTYYAPGSVSLDKVVKNICTQTLLEESDIDVTALVGKGVRGYTHTQRTTAKSVINDLRQAFLFDGVFSNGRIKWFFRNGKQSVVTIPVADLVFEGNDYLVYTRKPDRILPNSAELTYIQPELKYEQNTQFARRNTNSSKEVMQTTIAVSFTYDEAQQLVETMLATAWSERTEFTFFTGYKYLYLDSGDVVRIQTPYKIYEILLTGTEAALLGKIKFKGVSRGELVFELGEYITSEYPLILPLPEDGELGTYNPPEIIPDEELEEQSDLLDGELPYSNDNEGEGPTYGEPSYSKAVSLLQLLDVPQLTDTDLGLGFYLASGPEIEDDLWPGAVVFRSTDNTTYNSLAAINIGGIIGTTETRLLNGPYGIWDRGNTVRVKVNGHLASVSEDEIYKGKNLFVIGNEVLQAKDCVLISSGLYELRNLVRGRRGTEQYIGSHELTERVVLLSPTTIQNVTESINTLNIETYYKAITDNESLSTGTVHSFTFQGNRSKIWASVHIQGARAFNRDLIITWVERVRSGGEWIDLIDVTQVAANFSVEIYTEDGAELKRTVSVIANTSLTYTAEQQTEDSLYDLPILVKVYGITEVGQGFSGSVVLT